MGPVDATEVASGTSGISNYPLSKMAERKVSERAENMMDEAREQQVAHLENELAFYASYHSNKMNKLIHFCFIPQILWSSLLLLAHLNIPGFTFVDVAPGFSFRPSVAMILAMGFEFYYIMLDEFLGGTYMPFMAFMYLTATYLANHVPSWLPLRTAFSSTPSSLPFAFAIWLNGWAWQFYGHFKYEGRAPALTENLTQALVTAPFFVHIEALFAFFNWNPALHKSIQNLAGKRIVEMNRLKREGGKKTE